MVEECNAALARQPELASVCVFAADLKAIRFKALKPQTPIPKPNSNLQTLNFFSKLAGTNAVAVGKLLKGGGGSWGWTVSEYRCFPVLGAAAAAAAAASAAGASAADAAAAAAAGK